MKTEQLQANNQHDIQRAADLLLKGEIVAIPTETVYGLAANANNPAAVKKIFAAKNRPVNHPLIVHIHTIKQLESWVDEIPPITYQIAKKFWPGPLTLLFKKNKNINDVVTGGLETIGIRIPQSPAMLEIIEKLNSGLAAPSANIHKKVSPTTAQHVLTSLQGKIAAVIDGGPCLVGVESTILDLTQPQLKILRPGPISKAMLETYLGQTILEKAPLVSEVPGAMKVHYQPNTQTLMMSLKQIDKFITNSITQPSRYAVLHYSPFETLAKNIVSYKMSQDKNLYARKFYGALHELDNASFDKILIEEPPADSAWADIIDRLTKACAIDE